MPWYTGDWLKAPEIRSMPPDYRGLWFDLLNYMWESTERGVMVKPNGKIYTKDEIIRMVGLDNQNSDMWLTYIIENEICSLREEDGAIYSRHMVKDEKLRKIRKESGKLGGNPNLVKDRVNQKSIHKDNQFTEDENEYETENETKNGRFFKLIPKRFENDNEFWEAWKDWIDYLNETEQVKPKQAKIMLDYLDKHESPTRLLIQAFTNRWKGIIYDNKSNGKETKPKEIELST